MSTLFRTQTHSARFFFHFVCPELKRFSFHFSLSLAFSLWSRPQKVLTRSHHLSSLPNNRALKLRRRRRQRHQVGHPYIQQSVALSTNALLPPLVTASERRRSHFLYSAEASSYYLFICNVESVTATCAQCLLGQTISDRSLLYRVCYDGRRMLLLPRPNHRRKAVG